MGTNQLITLSVLMAIMFILYWQLLFRLMDNILEAPQLKKIYRIPVAVINTGMIFFLPKLFDKELMPYIILFALMIIEFIIFYKDKLVRILFCISACIIHILAIRALVVGLFSIFSGSSIYQIVTQEQSQMYSAIVTLMALIIAVICVLKFIPMEQVRIINQHKEQQWFLITWMTVNNIFLLYNATVLIQPGRYLIFTGDQVAYSLSVLLGLYIVLFFAMKTNSLLGYEEKYSRLEQTVYQEQQYRNAVTKDAIVCYEFNVTKNLMLNGFDDKQDELGDIPNYSDMLKQMSRQTIYSKDIPDVMRQMSPLALKRAFEEGKSETVVEYRRLLSSGESIWVRSVTNLVTDVENGDLKGFTCIKDIDTEKRHQLELQYKAERDPLTGLYNKEVTGKLISENLACNDENKNSALFMIDVDNFKKINDNMGHVYGDAVLCELAEKLHHVFSNEDIVGRIGGDEYIAFIKDGATIEKVKDKAKAICKEFYTTYQGQEYDEFAISSSVGVSLSPKDGNSFEELYNNADVALYVTKSEGKNSYRLYNGSDFVGCKSTRTEIETIGDVSQKNFRQNRIEYTFKMLYQSENSVSAIHSVLELVARHFSFERGYIFETSKDGKTTSNTFEWCAEGIEPQIDNLQDVPIEAVETANTNFYKTGTFILKTLDDLQPIERDVLEPQGIKSMFQFGIFDKNTLLGFIGFDNCRSESVPSDTDIDEMATICNILATFFSKQHVDDSSKETRVLLNEIMDNLDSYTYVINMDTFKVLFMNARTRSLMKDTDDQEPCYSFFKGNDKQCDDCPLKHLPEEGSHKVINEVYNSKLQKWTEVTASRLVWSGGIKACLINCLDITKHKIESFEYINQLEKLAYYDELTGARTYHKFKKDAQSILENHPNKSHLLVKLDIDNFKLINQIYGYEKGNEILCYVAKAIEKTTRNENEIFARIASDEFIAMFCIEDGSVVPNIHDAFINNFYSLMKEDLAFRFHFHNGRYIINPGDVANLDIMDMFEKVNIAHKASKLDESLQYVFYDESMTKDALHQKEVESKMEKALLNDEFLVYLQPKYFLNNETIGGAEALVRWENKNVDLFSPNAFISIFEKNGFITKLDIYMLHKVCAIIKNWIDSGIEPVTVSVNFSRLHLNNVSFVKELCEIVDSFNIARKYIEIEITETVIYDNIDTLEVWLSQLHKAGFSMSIDDFGTGYSSLGMLKNLPVDIIKMDRSFFVNQKDAERLKIIVGSVINMAANLGICIVAEGAEEKEHIDFLRELNCDMAQGFYYAKPMPVKDFDDLMKNGNMKH